MSVVSQAIVRDLILVMDFEKAIHRSLLKYFPNCQLVLCLFRFGQNHLIRDYGYKTQFQRDLTFSIYRRCFSALALLPASDIPDAFDELCEIEMIPDDFIDYFKRTYLG